jgi:hypothetical protein
MSYDVTIKRGDRRNCIKAVLKDSSGLPVNLANCSVVFRMAPVGRKAIIDRAAHIETAVAGEVWFVWAAGETDTSGVYRAEFQVTYLDGKKETFPNDGYIGIRILDNIRSG